MPRLGAVTGGSSTPNRPRRQGRILNALVEPLSALLRHLVELKSFPADTLFNVNFPGIPAKDIKGVRLTRLGRRVFSNSIKPAQDPAGRPIYWVGAGSMAWTGSEDSDYQAIADGYISVTPLHLDLTNRTILESSGDWWQIP